jgi:hypothetical protein
MSATDQIRLLLVEDVPQVAQYIRGLLNSQSRVKLLDVLDDGSKAVGRSRSSDPTSCRSSAAPGPAKGPACRKDP